MSNVSLSVKCTRTSSSVMPILLLQAPANIYYIPNFISEDEATFLWKQVDTHTVHVRICHSLISLHNSTINYLLLSAGICCSSSEMDPAIEQEAAKLGWSATTKGHDPRTIARSEAH